MAHGSLGTIKGSCPDHLPDWCKKARISSQYRLTDNQAMRAAMRPPPGGSGGSGGGGSGGGGGNRLGSK